jgi:hypothetical protein
MELGGSKFQVSPGKMFVGPHLNRNKLMWRHIMARSVKQGCDPGWCGQKGETIISRVTRKEVVEAWLKW